MTPNTIVLGGIDRFGPTMWNFFPNKDAALLALTDTKIDACYSVMTFGEFLLLERNHYLADPLKRIDTDTYIDALEVLPPSNWQGINSPFETFMCCERISGPYTRMYARLNRNSCFSRVVHSQDRTTWITRQECEAHHD